MMSLRVPGVGLERRTVPAWLAALIAYVIVAAAFLAPLFSRFGSAVIGTNDSMLFLWNVWWMEQSLFQWRNPFFTDLIFVPVGSPLISHSLAPLQSTLMALATRVMPIEAAWNLVAASALPLAGLSAWALCRQVSRDAIASWIGGLAFMLSPFLTSKFGSGWMNLLYAAVLPLFTLALLRATEPAHDGRKGRGLLAIATLLVIWTSLALAVFAANIAACILVWRAWLERAAWVALGKRWARACAPALVLASPHLALTAFYAVTEGFIPTARSDSTYLPHLTDFLLPTAVTSPYSDIVRPWVGTVGQRFDAACYLGILVLPMALFGLFRGRMTRHAWLFGGMLAFFLAISIGPFLRIDGEYARLFGHGVPLPFAIWREVPLLGMVGQTSRYMVIVYMAMAVGVSALIAGLRTRSRGAGRVVVVLAGLAICAEFAFQPILSKLPASVELSSSDAIVLDPRRYAGAMMYQQTLHGRPMVGGYLSRWPPRALEFYRERPGIACLMHYVRPRIPCEPSAVLPALRELGVTDVLAAPDDWRASLYQEIGLIPNEAHETTVVWAVPAAELPASPEFSVGDVPVR